MVVWFVVIPFVGSYLLHLLLGGPIALWTLIIFAVPMFFVVWFVGILINALGLFHGTDRREKDSSEAKDEERDWNDLLRDL